MSDEKGGRMEEERASIAKLDPNFKYEISQQHGGEDIMRCFQCGTCSAVCPVWEVRGGDDSQRIIKMALLGMRDEVLHSDFIWLCVPCYTCTVRCPKGVSFGDIALALRNLAQEEGIIPKYVQAVIDTVKKFGWMNEFAVTLKTKGITGLVGQIPFGLQLYRRGRLKILARPIYNVEQVRKMFDAVERSGI